MCGIAGVVNSDPGALMEAETIRRMCRAIAHRGPDDEGIYVHGPVGLGMRRLSIIDLAGGHQPISNELGTVWVVFNGEIYNYKDLKPELESQGHRFQTNTDTEVIVHLYEELGANCVHKLRGMFAFAVYDERARRLLLARDRLGIKPLHYAFANGRLWFASEIKAILAAEPELKQINEEALGKFFQFGYIPDPVTAFLQIQKLPPGHLLEFAEGRTTVTQYWDLPPYSTVQPYSEEECLEGLEERLAEAVRIRLMSDVPLGALLSGGVDSSTVVALMARASPRPVKTFSVGFSEDDFNESHHARLVAKRFGTDHYELHVKPDIWGTLDRLTRMMEEPFGDSSMIPTYLVSSLARRHVTVALSGDGGDELFAGYDRHRVHFGRRRFDHIPAWAGRAYRRAFHALLPPGMWGYRFAYNISLPFRERYLDGISYLSNADGSKSVLSREFREALANREDPLAQFRSFLERDLVRDPLSELLYLDTKTYLPADILTKVDRMSMATSLEARVPILDHVFVEYACSLPPNFKLRGKRQKYILKRLAERVGVPQEVIYRPKRGFSLPLPHWMRSDFRQDLVHILLEPRTIQRGYLNAQAVRSLLDEHLSGRRNHAGRLWHLLVFELWHRNYLEADKAREWGTDWTEKSEATAAIGTRRS